MFRKIFAAILMATCFVLIEMHGSQRHVQQTCLDVPSSVKMSITGHRNPSGHWESQVVVGERHGYDETIAVDVEYKHKTCTSEQSDAEVVLTFTVHPATDSVTNHTCGRHPLHPTPHPVHPTPYYPHPTPHPPHPNPHHPSGYVALNGIGYFKIYAPVVTWSAARQQCADDGAFLSSLDTNKKKVFVNALGTPGQWIWIGIHEEGTNGVYYTATGERWVKPAHLAWYPKQPNYPSGSDCLLIKLNDGRIGDNPCEQYSRSYVCEFPWH